MFTYSLLLLYTIFLGLGPDKQMDKRQESNEWPSLDNVRKLQKFNM